MKQIILIASQGIKKAIRDKIIIAMLLLFVPLLIGLHLFSFHSYTFQIKFVKDICFSYLSLLAGMMLLFLSSEQTFWFAKNNTPYHVLTRIKNRFHMITGVCLGISTTISISIFMASGIMLIFLKFTHGIWFWELLLSALLISFQFLMMTSVISFFASFLTKSSALSLSLLVYISGYINPSLQLSIQDNLGHFPADIYRIISTLLPDFTIFGVREIMVHDFRVTFFALISMILYSIFTSSYFLIFSTIIIQKRDL